MPEARCGMAKSAPLTPGAVRVLCSGGRQYLKMRVDLVPQYAGYEASFVASVKYCKNAQRRLRIL